MLLLRRGLPGGLRAAGVAAGAAVLAAGAQQQGQRAQCKDGAPQYKEKLARSTTIQRLQTYETMHGEVTAAQKQRLTDSFLTLARVVSPSTMRRLKVELVDGDQIAVSFRLQPVEQTYVAAQISEVLAVVTGAAPTDKRYVREATYSASDGVHRTMLRTDTGARVELQVETASGKTTLTLVSESLTPPDASRIEAAFRASARDRDGDGD